MVALSLHNSPQFIRTALPHNLPNDNWNLPCLSDMLEREGPDCLAIEVSQLVCGPFTLLRMQEQTMHRGIPNSEDVDRPLFFVMVNRFYEPLQEGATFKVYETK